MIDFNEEIKKYKPATEIEDIENTIQVDEVKDVMELLQHIVTQMKQNNKPV